MIGEPMGYTPDDGDQTTRVIVNITVKTLLVIMFVAGVIAGCALRAWIGG